MTQWMFVIIMGKRLIQIEKEFSLRKRILEPISSCRISRVKEIPWQKNGIHLPYGLFPSQAWYSVMLHSFSLGSDDSNKATSSANCRTSLKDKLSISLVKLHGKETVFQINVNFLFLIFIYFSLYNLYIACTTEDVPVWKVFLAHLFIKINWITKSTKDICSNL